MYNIGLQYTVPGSCPVEVAFPVYLQLTLTPAEQILANDTSYPTSLSFTWDSQQSWAVREAGKQLYAAWINLNNQPMFTPVTVERVGCGSTAVPEGMAGVAFMALTTIQESDFAILADATLVGPVGVSIS